MAIVRLRRNVWTLNPLKDDPTTPWDPILLWYARAVDEMLKRPISKPTSWKYQAAIHEYKPGVPPNTEPIGDLPSQDERDLFWSQCQHGSWFFLPWHRIYLACFEQIVAATIVDLGGPDDWALPYWNYSDDKNPEARTLHRAFRLATLPDGSPNALRIDARKTGCNTGKTIASAGEVDLTTCLTEPKFEGQEFGNHGFGGPRKGFLHNGQSKGKLENIPHASIHSDVGGFLGAFNSTGLDPLFWLHHANIDRVWEVWRHRDNAHVNPPDKEWLTDLAFLFHDAGSNPVSHTPSEFVDTKAAPLPFEYDDVSDPLQGQPDIEPSAAAVGVRAVRDEEIPELIGATTEPVVLRKQPASVSLSIGQPTGPAAARIANIDARGTALAFYLNIEHVTGTVTRRFDPLYPLTYAVYVNVPPNENPHGHPELLAGLMPMFGVDEATRENDAHAAGGLHFSLEITHLVQRLNKADRWNPQQVQVTFVPVVPPNLQAVFAANEPPPIQIGRVSVYVS